MNGDKISKRTAKLLNKDYVKKRGFDLSTEVLWVSMGERAAELPAVKVGGQKNAANWPGSNRLRPRQADWQNFFSNLQL